MDAAVAMMEWYDRINTRGTYINSNTACEVHNATVLKYLSNIGTETRKPGRKTTKGIQQRNHLRQRLVVQWGTLEEKSRNKASNQGQALSAQRVALGITLLLCLLQDHAKNVAIS